MYYHICIYIYIYIWELERASFARLSGCSFQDSSGVSAVTSSFVEAFPGPQEYVEGFTGLRAYVRDALNHIQLALQT